MIMGKRSGESIESMLRGKGVSLHHIIPSSASLDDLLVAITCQGF